MDLLPREISLELLEKAERGSVWKREELEEQKMRKNPQIIPVLFFFVVLFVVFFKSFWLGVEMFLVFWHGFCGGSTVFSGLSHGSCWVSLGI